MLPLPVSLSGRRRFSPRGLRSHRSAKDVLLTRARITNLGLLLLAGFTVLSLLLNLSYYFTSASSLSKQLPYYRRPSSILATIHRDESLSAVDHLVIVPGHAIWKGTDAAKRLSDDEWILEPYQRGGGRVSAFYNHIASGHHPER